MYSILKELTLYFLRILSDIFRAAAGVAQTTCIDTIVEFVLTLMIEFFADVSDDTCQRRNTKSWNMESRDR